MVKLLGQLLLSGGLKKGLEVTMIREIVIVGELINVFFNFDLIKKILIIKSRWKFLGHCYVNWSKSARAGIASVDEYDDGFGFGLASVPNSSTVSGILGPHFQNSFHFYPPLCRLTFVPHLSFFFCPFSSP